MEPQIFVVIALVVASAAMVSLGLEDPAWYAAVQPPASPPSWVFAAVWSVLYGSVAYSACRSPLVALHYAHLALGLLWCWTFFLRRDVCGAIKACVLVAVTALALVFAHRPVRWYLAPLALWCLYAVVLNQQACQRYIAGSDAVGASCTAL